MEEIEMNAVEINGKKYILLDKIENDDKNYYYFFEINQIKTIQILTEEYEKNETSFSSVDNENEFDKALSLFYLKHKDDNIKETTI